MSNFNQPKFLLGVWSQPTYLFDTWKSRGINTLLGYESLGGTNSMDMWDGEAKKRDFYRIRVPSSNLSADSQDASLLALVNPLIDSTGKQLSSDEPDIIVPKTDTVGQANIQSIALSNYNKLTSTGKPVFINFSGDISQLDADYYTPWAKASDWNSFDIYPICGWNMPQWMDKNDPSWQKSSIAAGIKKLNKAGSKRVFTYVELNDFKNPWVPSNVRRGPTQLEFWGQIWESVIYGAKGIFFFPQQVAKPEEGGFKYDCTTPEMATVLTQACSWLNSNSDFLIKGQWELDETLPGSLERARWTYNGKVLTVTLNASHQPVDFEGHNYVPFGSTGSLTDAKIVVPVPSSSSASPVDQTTTYPVVQPNKFIIGVWAQCGFIFQGKDADTIKVPQFPKWVKRGINTFVTNDPQPNATPGMDWTTYCKMAADAGAGAMILPSANPSNDPKSSGFVGWAQPDEPEAWDKIPKNADGSWNTQATTKAYTDRYRMVKAINPKIPVYGNFTGNFIWARNDTQPVAIKDYMAWFNACDWVSMDAYPRNSNKLITSMPEQYGTPLKKLREMSGNKPMLAYIESAKISTKDTAFCPTPEEFRFEVWFCLVYGVKGIVYFPFLIDGGFQWDATPPEIEKAMTDINGVLTKYSDIFIQDSSTVTVQGTFHWSERKFNGTTYRLIVNCSTESQQLNGVTYPPLGFKIVKTLNEVYSDPVTAEPSKVPTQVKSVILSDGTTSFEYKEAAGKSPDIIITDVQRKVQHSLVKK